MTLSEQIGEILNYVDDGDYIGISRDTPDLYIKAVRKMVAFELIVPRDSTYDLTKKGHKAIEKGGFDNWIVFDESQKAMAQGSSISIVGNNNSGIVQDSTLRDLNIGPNEK